ncbi:MAG: hypothetical protein ABEJ80_08115 [Halarchaeum sp.]
MFGVVGDGLAGLVAARRLREAGREAVVFGPSDGGPPEAAFPEPVRRGDDALLGLADDVGVAVSWGDAADAFYVDGTVHPLAAPWELVAFPYFGLYDAWRWSRLGRDGDAPGASESARERCVSRATRGVCDSVVDPLARAYAGAGAAAVDAAWFESYLAGRGERGRVDVSGLCDALRDGVDVRDARAVGLAADAGGVESLTVETAAGGRETHDVEGVVVAGGPDVLASLTGYECDLARREAVRATVRAPDPPTSARRVVVADDAPFDLLVRRGDGRVSTHATVAPGENVNFLGALGSLFPDFDPGGASEVRTTRAPSVVFGPGERGVPAASDATPGVYYAGVASESQRPAPSAGGAVRAGRAAAAAALAGVAR